jgi:ubiquinol oxidase
MTEASPIPPGAGRVTGAMGDLTAARRREEHQLTLAAPRRRYGWGASLLFAALDAVYGKPRTLSKFKVLELVARVPYQAWEQVAYIAITHVHERTGLARRIYDRVAESRVQQDNEQWHLLILEELIGREGAKEGRLKFLVIPQMLAFAYYQLSWVLYVINPAWSYRLNADFEDHAEHEYALLVEDHRDWDSTPFLSAFESEYGAYESLADLFRQISYDERVHKESSLADMAHPRFR